MTRFGDLFNLIYAPAFQANAGERMACSTGTRTPGIDRATVISIEPRMGAPESPSPVCAGRWARRSSARARYSPGLPGSGVTGYVYTDTRRASP